MHAPDVGVDPDAAVTSLVRIGKLPGAEQLASEFAQRAGALAMAHRDPFDRMLIARAQAEDLALITIERIFAEHGVRTLW